MSVTGRIYTTTRPRGYAPWKPQRDTRRLLEDVQDQLDRWRPQWPLTARQVFYGLVGRNALDKSERNYKRLLDALNRGRRAGMIEWHAIRDDGATLRTPSGFHDLASFWSAVDYTGSRYRRDRQDGQPLFIEVWSEAAGMVPQLESAVSDYGVPVASSGGFDSVTAKHEAAERFMERDVPTVVLHVGDYDPSGCAIVDSVAEDVTAFVQPTHGAGWIEFRRLAVTPEQIEEMDLPTAPAKATDRRGEEMAHTVQAEAIEPAILAELVVDAVVSALDMDVLAALRETEAEEREAITARLREMFA